MSIVRRIPVITFVIDRHSEDATLLDAHGEEGDEAICSLAVDADRVVVVDRGWG